MGKGTGRGGEQTKEGKAPALQAERLTSLRPASLPEVKKVGKVTWDELKKHRTPGDAWILVKGKVYDVSGWSEHPGGNVIFTTVGEDATDVFSAFHAGSSFQYLKEFEIGEIDYENSSPSLRPTQKQMEFEQAYRKLRTKLIMDGMFNASLLYYAYKMVSQVALWALGWYLASAAGGSWAMVMASALTYAFFLQQSGWLAHDLLHHQVFKNRLYGHVIGIIWGNIAQGFSISWWINKHNSHHAVPNLVESRADAADGDPDIDTMPFLAWSRQMFMQREEDLKKSAVGRFLIRYQYLFYFPLLGLARLSWALQGITAAFPSLPTFGWAVKSEVLTGSRNLRFPILEKVGMAIHYAWFSSVALAVARGANASADGGAPLLAAAQAFAWVAATNIFTGLLLAIVFGLGHNGMAVYHADKRPDFWTLQVSTTRNVIGNSWMPQVAVDWLCGGLQYQVEHHLFPQVPRHNLAAVHAEVVRFCRDEGVDFHEADVVDGTCEVLSHLRRVALEFEEHFPAL